ncbi:MAG TPA: PaaX family transcriptional regulator C-terminal domain-containing protein, partial [Ilumatobacter sp.]|nr:PaaX family transcriptional regulator C-terminal domain-containing protein [Ilumatobacter sp.]
IVVSGDLAGRDPHDVVAQLWDLDELAGTANRLLERIVTLERTLDWASHDTIPMSFIAAADVIRFLRREPRLPQSLTPPHWPVDELRTAYASFEQLQVGQLRRFLQAANTPLTPADSG